MAASACFRPWRLLFHFLLLSLSLFECACLLVPVPRWPLVLCFVISRDQDSPVVLSGLPRAVCTSGTVPDAIVPAKFVVSVFQATRLCRLPDWQCQHPLVFGVFLLHFLLLLLPFSSVLVCSCLCLGGLWLDVWRFHAIRAIPLHSLGCLKLFACLSLFQMQSC